MGHVGFSELLQFLSTATFGTFLVEDKIQEIPDLKFNMFHKAFLAWSFYRALTRENNILSNLIPINLRTTFVFN